MADNSSVVYPKFTGWVGESVFVNEGEPWAADDPFVLAHPEHFRSNVGPSLRRTGAAEPLVEQATAEPGEKRAARRGGSSAAK